MQALTGRGCGLGESATVMARTGTDVGAPTTPETRAGDFALAADDPSPVPAPGPGAVWHDEVELPPGADPTSSPGGVTGLGSLTTGWYPLPDVDPAGPGSPSHVIVPVAGNEPLPSQRCLPAPDLGGDLAPARFHPALGDGIELDVCDGVRRAADPLEQKPRQCDGLVCAYDVRAGMLPHERGFQIG